MFAPSLLSVPTVAPDGSYCQQFGHSPSGPDAQGWIFCSRCGDRLSRIGR